MALNKWTLAGWLVAVSRKCNQADCWHTESGDVKHTAKKKVGFRFMGDYAKTRTHTYIDHVSTQIRLTVRKAEIIEYP